MPNETNSKSPFIVVPPTNSETQSPVTRTLAPQTETTPNPPSNSDSFPDRRWLLVGGIIAGLTAISQLPVPNSVYADAQLEPLPNSREFVYTKDGGTVTKFLVQPGDQVQVNQPIATIKNSELDAEIADKKAKLQQEQANLEFAKQSLPISQGNINEAFNQEQAAQNRVNESRRDLERANSQPWIPEIQRQYSEIASIKSKISGLESKIALLKKSIPSVNFFINEYEDIRKQKLMGRLVVEQKLDELQEKRNIAINEITQKENEIKEIRELINAKYAAIDDIKKRITEQLALRQDELTRAISARKTAQQELKAAQAKVINSLPLVATLKAELERLQEKQQNNQLLTAEISGVVVNQDLYQKLGRKMQANEPVLEIANLTQLMVIIEVPQTDSDIVKADAKVTLKPIEPGFQPYTARIEKIEPVLQPDLSQQKQLLRVKAVVNNSGGRLLPGAKVHAQIEAEQITIYQKVTREFFKLVPVKKWF